jgi:hypothetical protein
VIGFPITTTRIAAFLIRGYSLLQYHFWRKTMPERTRKSTFKRIADAECSVCGATHDDEIHEATLSIHRWFQHQVTHAFEDDALYMPGDEPKQAAS